jgi:predicted amidophosphoribosyltransferase
VEDRTHIGEAGYQLKYQQSLPHFNTLQSSLCDAISYLPLTPDQRNDLLITNIPCDPQAANVGRRLAQKVAKSLQIEFARADLLCDKTAMKDLPVDRKIPAWQALYDREECIELHGDPEGKNMVVIDDLYQSGATLWCYAQYLKRQGAASVLGLPCVKSLRDTDNQ